MIWVEDGGWATSLTVINGTRVKLQERWQHVLPIKGRIAAAINQTTHKSSCRLLPFSHEKDMYANNHIMWSNKYCQLFATDVRKICNNWLSADKSDIIDYRCV